MPERCQPFVAFPKGDGRSDWSREADLRTRSDPRQTSKRTGTNEVRSEAWRDKTRAHRFLVVPNRGSFLDPI